MLKQIQFFGETEQGIFAQGLFAGAFEKTAGAPPFADLDTGEDLRRVVSQISKKDREKYCFVLVNALGAGEYFGSNINSDYFPWNSLAHEGEDYGYKTFLRAHAFSHHKNKDPLRAFGIPIVSLLNPRMKRVELIIKLDREKAKIEGADGIINRIDAGEFPDVSMGCKVPFDVCSICDHKSKTKDDYCEHMRPPPEKRGKYGPNKILPDGRRICVINLYPRFFDISFVFIGADKTAKVMAKLAFDQTKGLWLPDGFSELSADAGHRFYTDLGASYEKTASVHFSHVSHDLADAFGIPKVAAQKKLAEKIKQIPAGSFAVRKLPSLERSEKKLPVKALEKLSEYPLTTALGALSSMGIVLRPEEFQDLVLTKMGEAELRQDLEAGNMVFRPTDESSPVPIETDREEISSALDGLLPSMRDVIKDRTAFGDSFVLRSMSAGNGAKNPLPTPEPVEHSLLDKLSAAYNGYRRDVLFKLSSATEMVQSDPRLREAVLGNGLVDMFSKTASSSPVITLDSVAYLMGAHFSDREHLNTTAVAEAIAVSNHGLLSEGQ